MRWVLGQGIIIMGAGLMACSRNVIDLCFVVTLS